MRVLTLGLSFVGVAAATPIQLTETARIVSASGAPRTGPVTLDVGIYPDGGTSSALFGTQIATVAQDGVVQVVLTVDDALFDGSPRYVGFEVDGVPVLPRQLVGTVPQAIHATNVSGGDVAVGGLLTLGSPSGSSCAVAGALRYDPGSASMQHCDGTAWQNVWSPTENVADLASRVSVLEDEVDVLQQALGGLRIAAMHCYWDGTTYSTCNGTNHTHLQAFDLADAPTHLTTYNGLVAWPIIGARGIDPHCVMSDWYAYSPGTYRIRTDASPGGIHWACTDMANNQVGVGNCPGWQTWVCLFEPS